MSPDPSLFADLIGQPQAVALLLAGLERRRLAPAYLFAGPEGVGRRLATLRFLEGVLAGPGGDPGVRRRLAEGNHPDVLWVEPTYQHQGELVPASRALEQGVTRRTPPQLRLEQIRDVSRFLARRAVEAPGCLVVLDGAEAMAEAAANALLKTLEEPGEGRLVLITAAPERLLATIRSRCQTIPFGRLNPGAMAEVLARCQTLARGQATPRGQAMAGVSAANAQVEPEAESQAPPFDPLALVDPPALVELAAGSPGALLSHRQQWQSLPEGLAERLQQLGSAGLPLQRLELAREICEGLDGDQQLWLVQWWQLVLWRSGAGAASLHRLNRLRSHLLAYVQPRLAWEVALLDLARGMD